MIFERVMAYCKHYNMSIAAFERMCNIGNGTIRKWETRKPSMESMLKIEKATKIPLSEWVKGE